MAYSKKEDFDQHTTDELIKQYGNVIDLLGEDPDREGLIKTPNRVAKAMQFMTQGYRQDADAILNMRSFMKKSVKW